MKLHKIKKANRRTEECRISNFEGWKRFAKSFLKQTEYIHSTFDVGRSMFGVHQFPFRFDRPFFWPAAGLTPETYNQRACCPAGATFSERSLGKILDPYRVYSEQLAFDFI